MCSFFCNFFQKKPYMSIHPANHSDTIRQMKETSKLSDTPHKRTLSEHRNRGSAQLRQHANLKGNSLPRGQRPPRTLGLPIQAMPGAMRDWILPPRGGRAHEVVMLDRTHRLPASLGAGRAVYPTLLEVSFICLLVLL